MGYYNYISFDVDVDDALDKIDDDIIKDYVLDNKIVSISDFDFIEANINMDNLTSAVKLCDEREFYLLLESFRNKVTKLPRTKQEMKDFICEIIDNNCRLN